MRKLFLLIILILALLVPGTAVLADGEDLTDWNYRQQITFDNSLAEQDLVDFPVLIYLNSSNFDFSYAQLKGEDIRFVNSDGSLLSYEIVSWDYDPYNIQDASAELWVNIPIIKAGSTEDWITMYWGNSYYSSAQDVEGTWNEDFVFVGHMNDNGDGTGIFDSTSYENHGTKVGSSIEVSGLVGKAQQFNGSSDYITIPSSDSLNSISTELTIEVVVKTSADQWQCPVARGYHWSNDAFGIWDAPEGGYFLRVIKDGGGEGVPKIAPFFNIFGLISATYDNGTGKIYRDGELKQTKTGMSDLPDMTGMALTIGRDLYDYYWNGLIDEIRISKTARSASWIEATNLNLMNKFATFGSVQGKPELISFTSSVDDVGNTILQWLAKDATSYKIVRAQNKIPSSLSEGVEVYSGNNLTYTDYDTNDLGDYYYSIWGISDFGISDKYLSVHKGGAMSVTVLFTCLIALACFLTWFASRRPEMLLSFAAGITWLGLAFWVLLGDLPSLDLLNSWAQMVGWVFVIMAFIPFILQMNVEIKKEKQGTSWSTYGKEPVDQIRPYEDYKDKLYSRTRKDRR